MNDTNRVRPDEVRMLEQLKAAIRSLTQAVGSRGRTCKEAMQFEAQINGPGRVLYKLECCNDVMVIFCECFETGTHDSLFRDLYARDLTFRSTWLDFLTSLLTYVETMNTCESVIHNEGIDSYVLQTRTLIVNARKQLNIERNKASKPWFVGRNKARRKKAIAAFGRTLEDAGTLYNMRDILNEM